MPDTDNGKAAREAGYCRTFNHRAMQTLATGAYDTLVIAARWGSCRFDDDFAARFTAAVHELRRHVRHIVILGPTPTLRDAAPDCVAMQAIDACTVPRAEFDQSAAGARRRLAAVAAADEAIEYLDPADFFCDAERCPVERDGVALYRDSNHVTSTAARRFAERYRARAQRR